MSYDDTAHNAVFELRVTALGDGRALTEETVQSLLTNCGPFDPRIELHRSTVESARASTAVPILRAPQSELLVSIGERLRAAGASTLIIEVERTEPNAGSLDRRNFARFFAKYAEGLTRALELLEIDEVHRLVNAILDARRNKRKIFICGNGGSAANASHLATDLSKVRFANEASLFKVISLTDNTPWITATANDFGYDKIFTNQMRTLLEAGDLVIAISSSGNSPNIIDAVEYANSKGAHTFGVVGFGGGELLGTAHASVLIPSRKGQYGFMEDVTSVIVHIVSIYITEQDRARFVENA